jgi:hypothetical protein
MRVGIVEDSMDFEPPQAVEIKMDAEIGSYQEEFEFDFPPVPAADGVPALDTHSGAALTIRVAECLPSFRLCGDATHARAVFPADL